MKLSEKNRTLLNNCRDQLFELKTILLLRYRANCKYYNVDVKKLYVADIKKINKNIQELKTILKY